MLSAPPIAYQYAKFHGEELRLDAHRYRLAATCTSDASAIQWITSRVRIKVSSLVIVLAGRMSRLHHTLGKIDPAARGAL